MSTPNGNSPRRQGLSTRGIQRAIWIVLAALLTSLALFGGYYYWDRYVRLKNASPQELDIQHLEEAIRTDPQKPETRVALAQYYLGKGMLPEALDQATQVLNAYPDDTGALLVAGITYARMNEPEAALVPLQKFVELRKGNQMAGIDTALETAYYFLGECYVNLKRPADAIPALEAALAISSTDADALYQLGRAYQASGKSEAALERYQRAVRLVPDFAEVYGGMIESYTALNQPDYVAYARGMQAFSLQDYGTAQTQLEGATKALPKFAPAFVGLGLTYEKLGQLDSALAAIERALELDPGDFIAQQAQTRIQTARDTQG